MIINPLTVLTLYVLPFSEGKGPTSQVQRGIANGVVLFKEVGDWVQTIFLNFSKEALPWASGKSSLEFPCN